MLFSPEQKKIAGLLMSGPKTEDEIKKALDISYDKLIVELKEMIKLGLIIKEGYPVKYALKQEIIDEVNKRRAIAEKDQFKIRINAIIELKAIQEDLLKKHIQKIQESIQSDNAFTVYSISSAEIIYEEENEMYSSFIEANLSVKDFPTLIRFLFYYGPTSIEVIRPEKIELTQFEFQEGLIELSSIFQKYADFLYKHLTKEELAEFEKKLYK